MAFVPSPIVATGAAAPAPGVHGASQGVPRPSGASASAVNVAGLSAVTLAAAAQRRGKRLARRAERAKAVATEEDEDVGYRSATPRERQFGMYESSRRRSQGQAVELPLSQLHVVAAQRQLPMLLEAVPGDPSEAIAAWSELLASCQAQAPELLATWSCGVGPLLRLAVAVPKEHWLRDPQDLWCEEEKREVKMDGPEGPLIGVESLPKLEKLIRHLLAKYDDAPMLLANGFLWNDGAGGTLREHDGREVVLCSAAGMDLCVRFMQLFREVCQGTRKPVAAAQDLLSPTLTKKMVAALLGAEGNQRLPFPAPVEVPDSARHVQPVEVTLQGPLMALRRAQLQSLGSGDAQLAKLTAALAQTRLAKDLGDEELEQFALDLMAWLARFAEEPEFEEPSNAGLCVEWLLSQRALDPKFSLVVSGNPRAPKKVLAAAKRDAATLELERLQQSGQRFLPNPAGIKAGGIPQLPSETWRNPRPKSVFFFPRAFAKGFS
eukprot:s5480_g1.t1